MLVSLNNIEFKYIEDIIFSGVCLTVDQKDRIGLVGVNGAGKTTLLNVIVGELEPTDGELFLKSDLRIGYLKQNSGLESTNTVYKEMLSVFSDVSEAVKRQEKIYDEMASIPEGELRFKVLSSEYESLASFIAARDGYNAEVKVKSVLNGMGFDGKFDQVISTMSGGEKTRLALAKLLLQEPELLILDEPTNHLDFSALSYLEGYLAAYKGALLVVSHDRYFLDKVVTTIWDAEDGNVVEFTGNYTKYKKLKAENVLTRSREFQKQQEKIAAMEDYIARNMVRASTSKSARSRVKQLANMETIEKPRTYTKPPIFNFEYDFESGKTVLTVDRLTLKVGERTLLSSTSFEVMRGEKVGILGPNGTGKSTLVRALVARGNPSIRYGVNVKIGYYDQENLNLDPNNTVLYELWGRHSLDSQTKIRSLLGGLQLGTDDIEKQVGVLSGGERAKLGFAIAMAEKANTLILDEPTNHLDLLAREALEAALRKFTGTIIFVSHDRYFLNAVADRILELSNLGITSYPGNYSKYEDAKKLEAAQTADVPKAQSEKKPNTYRSAKDRSREVKTKQRIAELEKIIAALELEIEKLTEESLAPDVISDYIKYGEYEEKIKEAKTKLGDAYDEWMGLQEE